MTWQRLLNSKRVQAHKTNKQELDDIRAVIERDLHHDAGLTGLSADRSL
jgi:hypothetical protein